MIKTSHKKSLIIITVIILIIGGILGFSILTLKTFSYEVKTFSSYEELYSFLEDNYQNYNNYNNQYGRGVFTPMIMLEESEVAKSDNGDGSGGDISNDYSITNIQVEGVDEPDTVKTDGKYLYILADQILYIINAYPADQANILSKISFKDNIYINNFFVSKDYLIMFGSSYSYPILYEKSNIDTDETRDIFLEEYSWDVATSVIKIYDISDRQNPVVEKDIEIDGNYFNSRMIGNYAYVISTEFTYDIYRAVNGNASIRIPEIKIDDQTSKISYDDIYYIDSPEIVDTMTHFIAINLDTMEVNEKSFLIGISQTMYVSLNNIYLVYINYYYVQPLIRDIYQPSTETTMIHKINIDSGEINYQTKSEVPGHVLNQFSMDEYNGYFRIATTIGYTWDEINPSSNNIYILDENLERVSEIEGIAYGEQIYSARFTGDKAYIVTFKNIDPFFTIDLSDPRNPQILGYLKIPGYSTYLHPYDDNHIIGIGKDAVESNNPNFAWYQGLKISLFDVSDFENPQELDKVIIGDRGTDSSALYDHKAFLFDKEKQLLVIPIILHEINEEIKNQYNEEPASEYGEFTYQGVYVYKLNLDGFEYKGRITHMSEEEKQYTEYWWYWYESSSYISRSLYIGNVLYTISDKMIKMNNIDDLSEINSINLD
ncbi:MAG: beta-propeller domain-containing protein [Thermoplasmatales archaeon]|nr:MAG: beta-propeller domain-containing protein [Thermoplasmatales archaeon]